MIGEPAQYGPGIPVSAANRCLALTHEVYAVLSADGVLLDASGAWLAALGRTPSEVRGRMLPDLMDEGDGARLRRAIEGALTDAGSVAELTTRCRHPDGSPRMIAWRLASSGEPGSILAAGKDVTELDAPSAHDADGVDDSMADRIGVAQDELARRVADASELARAIEQRNRELDKAWWRAFHAVHRMERLQAATAALARAHDWPTIAAVFKGEGLALSGAGAGGFYLLSPDGQWLEPLRPDARASAAASRDARIEVGRVSFIHDAVRRAVPVYLASAADGKDQVDQPLELAGLDGRAWVALPLKVRGGVHGILILAFAEPQNFPAGLRGSLEALAAQCSQATERILVYEEAVNARWAAEAANRAKSQFLAMMSHELRTPLNAIGGYAELMDLGLRGPVTEAQRADLARIQRSKQHLLVIIDDLLDHARLEAGRLTLQLAPLSLQDVLRDVEALMAPQIAWKGLRLDTSGCATDAVVRADRDKLCQVLTNLVSNALRFTDSGGTIRIDCESAPPDVRVRVTDTGIGIPEQQREAIFEPFTQVDTGLTRRAGGTGLGLAISRQLTEAMGGTLTVESVLGAGSTFAVSLPLVPHGPLPPGLDLPDRGEARGERETHDMA